MKIQVKEFTGRSAVASSDGTLLLEKLEPFISRNENVELDFNGVDLFASPFFNASFAILVRQHGEDFLSGWISTKNLSDLGGAVLKSSIKNAIETKDKTDEDRLNELMRMIREEE